MKKLTTILAAVLLSIGLNAQINIGANFIFGVPTGDFSKAVNTAVGGSIEANFFLNEKISIGPEVQFISFAQKDGWDFNMTAQIIPISVKGEYYFMTEEWQPYVGLGVGYYLVKTEIATGGDGLDIDLNGFGISPRVGVIYNVSEKVGVVFNGQYNVLFGQSFDNEAYEALLKPVDNTGFFNLTLGVRFAIAD